MSPTQRSLKRVRERGWEATVVEKYNHFARVRQDAFGFGDILLYHPILKVIALLQTTTQANFNARRKKIAKLREARGWKAANGKIILHGWKGNDLKELYL